MDVVNAFEDVQVVGAFHAVEPIGEVRVKNWENNTVADWESTDAALPVLDHYLGQWEQKTGHYPVVTEMKSKGCTETQSH